ncbi:hypothetical protein LMH73_009160 [Vibrio splendidus]|nr:hypothetical protein [Vibrio splendidus]MCC4880307.1 hypothetical protein [Vibrio splendidus]
MTNYDPSEAVAHMPKQKFHIGISDIAYTERMRAFNSSEYAKNRPTNETGISAVDDFCHDVYLQIDIDAIAEYDKAYIEKHGELPVEPHKDDLISFSSEEEAIAKCSNGAGAYETVISRSAEEAILQVSSDSLKNSLERNKPSHDWVMDF